VRPCACAVRFVISALAIGRRVRVDRDAREVDFVVRIGLCEFPIRR
jgi:hypothetical protein